MLAGMRRVGVLLSGCGTYDGSEAQETVILVLALRRLGLRPVFLAPDAEQRDVVDHTTGETVEDAPARRVLLEAGRLSRGVIRPLGDVAPGELDALVIPGGLGTVKNLCLAGKSRLGGETPRPEVAALLDDLASRGAPVAAVGLARVVLDRHANRPLSNDPIAVSASEVVVDEAGGSLFTPGFMGSSEVTEVAVGLERLVAELGRRLGVDPALRVRKGATP